MIFCGMHILLISEIRKFEIADNYGLVTCVNDIPIGFVTWDPRHIPEYAEIGHNGIREQYKRRGYGHT